MTSRTRFALAAAAGVVALVVAGAVLVQRPQAQVGNQSPTPPLASPSPSPVSLQDLQAKWESVGPRPVPPGDSTRKAMTIDQAGLRIASYKGDITSLASMPPPAGQLVLDLTNEQWECTTGDRGTYDVTLSPPEPLAPDQQLLTLTSAGDSCDVREGILAGDWRRWPCPPTYDYAFCTGASEKAAGRYVAPYFKPFGRGTSGQLAYTIPTGWAQLDYSPAWAPPGMCFSEDSTVCRTNFILTTLAAPGVPAITVSSALAISHRPVTRGAPTLTCPSPSVFSALSAAEIADHLGSLPWLTVSNRVPLTVGGLPGVRIDVSLTPGFVDPCSHGTGADGTFEYSKDIEVFTETSGAGGSLYLNPDTAGYAKFVILDISQARVVIALTASDRASLDALSANTMPVIETFEFIR